MPLSPESTGHFTVPVFVNGEGPFQFIVDTGADESAVYSWFAKSLHLPKGANRELSGATGSVPMSGTLLSTLALDGHTIKNVDADTIPDRPDGKKIAGIVGVDLLANQLAVIDFGKRVFSLRPIHGVTQESLGKLITAGSIPGGNQFTFPVMLNGVTGTAVLDTGARGTIINFSFAKVAGVQTQSPLFRDGTPARGATSTPILSRVGPIGTVEFAGVTRNGVIARVADLPYWKSVGMSDEPAMNLGVDLLQRTRLTIDYSSRRFWLSEPSK